MRSPTMRSAGRAGARRSGASSRSRSRSGVGRSARSLRPRSERPGRAGRSGRVALGARAPRPERSSSVSLRYGPNPPSARPPWRLVRSDAPRVRLAGRPLPPLRTAPDPGARGGRGFLLDAARNPPSALPGTRPVEGRPVAERLVPERPVEGRPVDERPEVARPDDGRPVAALRPDDPPAPLLALDARGGPPFALPFGAPFDPPGARPFDPPVAGRPSEERPRPGPYFGIVFRIRRSLEWCGGVLSVSRRENAPAAATLCAAGAFEKSRRRPTLPGSYPPSTIGAGGLHDRVRNGNGCFPAAIATGNLWSCHRSIA